MRPTNRLVSSLTARPLRDERGIAMVSVVLMGAILFGVAATVMSRNISDYNQVRNDRRFEQAIQVADSGVDHTLYKVGATPSYSTPGDTLPANYDSWTPAEEETWVRANVEENPLVTTPEGQWATIRPKNAAGELVDVIYSVGYVPTSANPFKVRIIRAAFDFAPFVPGEAVLTDGDLHISGGARIDGAQGNVHSNGDVTLEGSPTVTGYASASGDYEAIGSPTVGQALEGQPEREVPVVDPRENYSMSEYDLCPNGEVRTGPSYSVGDRPPNTSGVPCGGTPLADASTVEYKAWDRILGNDPTDPSKRGARWRLDGPTGHDGVYYIYQGSAEISGSPGSAAIPWNVTIFAEATPSAGGEPGHCPHIGGDIRVSGSPVMRRHDKGQPLQFVAGRDLVVAGNPGTTYEGVLAAHEQFSISGHPTIRGVVIANDYCDTTGSPVPIPLIDITGSAHITYDGGLEVPLGRRVRTTHWNEL